MNKQEVEKAIEVLKEIVKFKRLGTAMFTAEEGMESVQLALTLLEQAGEGKIRQDIPKRIAIKTQNLIDVYRIWHKDTAEHRAMRDNRMDDFVADILELSHPPSPCVERENCGWRDLSPHAYTLLRAENKRYREALEKIIDLDGWCDGCCIEALYIAESAFETGKEER